MVRASECTPNCSTNYQETSHPPEWLFAFKGIADNSPSCEELLKAPSYFRKELAHSAALPGNYGRDVEVELLGQGYLREALPLPLHPYLVAEVLGLSPRVVAKERQYLREMPNRDIPVTHLPITDRRFPDTKRCGHLLLPEAMVYPGLP